MQNKPLILVTNDDGIEAKGLKSLMNVAMEFGEVVAISSQIPMSGMSHSITIKVPLRVNLVDEIPGLKLYLTTGTPVDGVKLAFHSLLGKMPDLVLSGINHGSNSSSSILYSGTMGAAMEGAINHIPSMGFSLLNYDPDADFGAAEHVARNLIRKVIGNGLPEGICLNVNVPDVAVKKLKGIRICTQANGYWKEEFQKRKDPIGKEYYWLTGFFHNREPEGGGLGTDEWALEQHYASVVPVKTDLTAHAVIETLKSWENTE
jgi:5'-nucleotidase